MSTNMFRSLILAWLLCGIICGTWSIFHGWADWPAEAQTYASWSAYANLRLPFPLQALLLSVALILIGAVKLFFRPSAKNCLVLCFGLLLLAYSKYNGVPAIASSAELTFNALFFVLSGVLIGASFSKGQFHEKSQGR
jgi:hypothetical protein